MIDAIREVIVAKAEASRRMRSGPTPSFLAVIAGCAVIAVVIAVVVAAVVAL